MPFFEIPPHNLEHLPLFGCYELSDEGDFAWFTSSRGPQRLQKLRPIVWLDNVGDAIQLGAVSVIYTETE